MKEKFYLNNIRNINFYSTKEAKIILSYATNNKIFVEKGRQWNNETYKSENYIEFITLNNEIIFNRRKANFTRLENFILSNNEKYFKTQDLYINIDLENIIIEQLEDNIKEFSRGEKHIYNNYIVKNLNATFNDKELTFFTEKEIDVMSYKEINYKRIEKITDKIERLKNTYFTMKKDFTTLKNHYLNKIKEGFEYCGLIDVKEETNIFYINNFSHIEESKESKLYHKNYKFLNDNYKISLVTCEELFKALNIDVCKIDIEELIKNKNN